jgi:hypothetical protein
MGAEIDKVVLGVAIMGGTRVIFRKSKADGSHPRILLLNIDKDIIIEIMQYIESYYPKRWSLYLRPHQGSHPILIPNSGKEGKPDIVVYDVGAEWSAPDIKHMSKVPVFPCWIMQDLITQMAKEIAIIVLIPSQPMEEGRSTYMVSLVQGEAEQLGIENMVCFIRERGSWDVHGKSLQNKIREIWEKLFADRNLHKTEKEIGYKLWKFKRRLALFLNLTPGDREVGRG